RPALGDEVAAEVPRVRDARRLEGLRARVPGGALRLRARADDCVRRRRERRRARRVGGLRDRGRQRPRAGQGRRRLDLPACGRGRRRSGSRSAPRLTAMIDLKAARADPDRFRRALARKGGAEAFDKMLVADERWRALVPKVDELRARQKLDGKPTPEQLEQLGLLKEELRALEERLAAVEAERNEWLAQVPNPPDPSSPDGDSEEDAEELRRWGDPAPEGPEHTEVGRFDLERAARLSGSRFGFLIGDTALVAMALYRFAVDVAGARGHTPVIPPVLVREEAMYGTGFFPTERSNIYALE